MDEKQDTFELCTETSINKLKMDISLKKKLSKNHFGMLVS